MSITYPLVVPYPAPSDVRITATNTIAVSQSQFTGAQQVQQWPGEWWELEASLPKMIQSDAQHWEAFLASLRGQFGTFMMGPAGLVIPSGAAGQYCFNFLRKAEDFTVAPWTPLGGASAAAASGTGPFGGFNPGGGSLISFPDTTGTGATAAMLQAVQANANGQWFTVSCYVKAPAPCTVNLGLSGIGATVCNVTTVWQRFSYSVLVSTTQRSLTFVLSIAGQPETQVQAVAAQVERNQTAQAYAGSNDCVVSGAGQVGSKTLMSGGWNGYGLVYGMTLLKAGDWFQVGSHLYMSLTDVIYGPTPSIDVFPALRGDAIDQAEIIPLDPMGIWRLADNQQTWGRSPGSPSNIFDFSIKCREAI